eukprot:NODE_251_length_12882_cov_0.075334.p5 type:complete len:298 gc:universal NODE_251_length_12882_cov_0.075334:11120-10227(-)
MGDLPIEILIKILADVDKLTRYHVLTINKKWLQASAFLLYQEPKLRTLRQVKKLKKVIDTSLDGFTTIDYHAFVRGIDLSNLEDGCRSTKLVGEWVVQLIKMSRTYQKIDSAMDLMTISKKSYKLVEPVGQLRNLDLGFCKAVRNNELCLVRNYCTKLLSLNLSGGSRSDKIMMQLSPKCTLLTRLSLAWNVHLSDLTLFSIAQHCHSLQSIDVSHCTDMSDDGIKSIAQYCPIEYISVNWCPRISLVSLSSLIDKPGLKLLNCIGTDCDLTQINSMNKNKELRINEMESLPFYENK